MESLKKDELEKLIDIRYPDSVEFPLLNEEIAVIGPITFDAIALIEEKFGSLQSMQTALSSKESKQSDIFSVIYMLLENKDAFDGVEGLAKVTPVMAVERLMQIVYHFMNASFPDIAETEDSKADDGKK